MQLQVGTYGLAKSRAGTQHVTIPQYFQKHKSSRHWVSNTCLYKKTFSFNLPIELPIVLSIGLFHSKMDQLERGGAIKIIIDGN